MSSYLNPTAIGRTRTARRLPAYSSIGCLVALVVMSPPIGAQTRGVEYRVVYASWHQLARQLDAAGRDGYTCAAVARPDPGVAAPGIVVVLTRSVDGSGAAVGYQVIAGGWMGTDLQPSLDRAGADGFRLCGVVLDESGANPALVAVMSRDAVTPPRARRYNVEVLTNYKASLVRLGDFPYLTSGDRLVIAERSQSASTDVEEDRDADAGRFGRDRSQTEEEKARTTTGRIRLRLLLSIAVGGRGSASCWIVLL